MDPTLPKKYFHKGTNCRKVWSLENWYTEYNCYEKGGGGSNCLKSKNRGGYQWNIPTTLDIGNFRANNSKTCCSLALHILLICLFETPKFRWPCLPKQVQYAFPSGKHATVVPRLIICFYSTYWVPLAAGTTCYHCDMRQHNTRCNANANLRIKLKNVSAPGRWASNTDKPKLHRWVCKVHIVGTRRMFWLLETRYMCVWPFYPTTVITINY